MPKILLWKRKIMADEYDIPESPEGIFAIIDDDSQDVVMLYFYSAQGDLKRANGDWKILSISDDDLLEGNVQVAVLEDFTAVWDAAEKSGKILTDSDVDRYAINLEQ